jgi:hypothetical protein
VLPKRVINASGRRCLVSAAEAHVRSITPSRQTYLENPDFTEPTVIRDYFGDDAHSPQAFLVERLPAQRTVRAHFHPVDQFQIFFPAPGVWYKRGAIQHLTVHYADAFVTYGPFGSNDFPMSFFTLRCEATGQTSYMPEALDDLPRVKPRGRNIEVHIPSSASVPCGASKDALIPGTEDGLAVHLLTLGPELPVDTSISPLSPGQYYYILEGSLRSSRREYPDRSLGWRAQERDFRDTLVSGALGCRVKVMQFPCGQGRVMSPRRRTSDRPSAAGR